MGAIYSFEQRLEHLVTGAFARVFRSAVQPMEIAAALQREVDHGAQILSRDRRIVPNDFTIDLSASDYDRLSSYGQALSSELASMLHEHTEEQHYVFAGPVHLNFQRSAALTTGRFRVVSNATAQVTPSPRQRLSDPAVGQASVFLEVAGARHPLTAPRIVVGRGSAADLRIDDAGVSRRHVEFRLQAGPTATSSSPSRPSTVTVVDLGSTNGTTVDGRRVQHAVLSDGSVVQIGSTRIVLRVAGQPAGPGPLDQPYAGPGNGPFAPPPWQGQPGATPRLAGQRGEAPYGQPAGPPADQPPSPLSGHPPPQPYSSRTHAPPAHEGW